MSELISGKEAKIAWANGEKVEYYKKDRDEWFEVRGNTYVSVFDIMDHFRLKPRTIIINGIELPAPFEPKDGDVRFVPANFLAQGYLQCKYPTFENHVFQFGVWRTEDEIKQVVSALRKVLKGEDS